MKEPELPRDAWECVDPELGAQLWRRDDPRADTALRARLERHVALCDSCRLSLAATAGIADGLRDGSLAVPAGTWPAARRVVLRRRLAGGGAGALAAGLALMLLLPPVPTHPAARTRGAAGAPRFLRPAESEIVLSRSPALAWTPIAGASGYRLLLSAEGASYACRIETSGAAARVPADAPLPPNSRIRAILEVVPPDLAPPAGVTVSFRTGSPAAVAGQRLTAAPLPARLLAALGLLLLLAAGWEAGRAARWRTAVPS